MRNARRRQKDLFDEAAQLTELQPDLRSRLAPLLQALLAEAAGVHQRQTDRPTSTARRRVMTRITPDHLARGAFIYVRQSTSDQVLNNRESRRRQYGLADRARALGWAAVQVIDDDLGRSGSGIARPGFEKLLAAICEGRRGSRATAVTGTRCWSSVAWSAR